MAKNRILFIGLVLLVGLLAVLDLYSGAAHLSLQSLWTDGLEHRIMWQLRWPRMLTAILAGAALSLSGLEMQTLFRNPLAGPSVLGVTSGATLGVAALVVLGSRFGFLPGSGLTILFAIAGALFVLLTVLLIASRVKSNVTLLIVGMMVGAIAGALVNVLQNAADPDSLKLFITWTLGSLSAVGWREMEWLAPMVLAGVMLSIGLMKPLNGLQLGEEYAASLGVHIRLTRTLLVLATGLMAGAVTAFCGPIAFVGVAVPHLTRGLWGTSNHRITIPATMLVGAALVLVCDILCNLATYPLPISTLSSLFGAPVVLYVILHEK